MTILKSLIYPKKNIIFNQNLIFLFSNLLLKKKVVSKSGGCITTNDSIKLLNDERDAKRRKIEEAEMNFNKKTILYFKKY
jgi:hypothetical protein